MLENRIIPCLLIKNQGLVKTTRFKDPKYIGDPINAVRIFNEKEVDELIFLDITATLERRIPSTDLVAEISAECFMPLAYGGGVSSPKQMEQLLKAGAEKICINSASIVSPLVVKEASDLFGAQAVIVSIDAKKKVFGGYEVYIQSGSKNTGIHPVEHAKRMEQLGAGEIFINSIDKDGTMSGYDIELVSMITQAVSVPVVACGGAGRITDFKEVVQKAGASAAAAGSFFVFHGPHRAVLISYPTKNEISSIF